MIKLQEFYLLRKKDVSKVSGTGIVARGVILPSHRAVLEWTMPFESITIFQNLGEIERIHGHEGNTEVILGSPPKTLMEKKK